VSKIATFKFTFNHIDLVSNQITSFDRISIYFSFTSYASSKFY